MTRVARTRQRTPTKPVARRKPRSVSSRHSMTSGAPGEPAERRLERAALSILEEIPDAVFIAEADGRIRSANRAASAVFGLPAAEILTRDIESLVPGWRAHPAAHDKTGRRGDGTLFPVRVTMRPLDSGGEAGLIAIIRDLSPIKALESRLDAAQKMETVGLVASGVAHDFNNLLTIVCGSCDNLLAARDWPEPQRDGLERIAVAAEQAASLAGQLLALGSRRAPEPETIDLHEGVAETAPLLKGILGRKVALDLELPPEPVHVRLNRSEIGQVLINLAINARDAMPRGGRFSVSTRLTPDAEGPIGTGSYVELTVGDTGSGMSPDTKTRAFEPFFTTKNARQGTGLGLASVARIVQQGGGAIRLESAPGEGTTFVILLPIHRRGPAAPAADQQEPAPATPVATALVVEDDPAVRDIVATMLRDLGYRTLEADGVDGALTALRDAGGGVDLVVSDVMMDGLAGPDLVARLREEVPALKVLFMSGYAEDDEISEMVTRGDAVFVRKPFTRQTLAKWLRRALGGSPHLTQVS